ncbi:MAG: FG-GAP repeat domain-containing protein [Verrucomicrobiales bacterium]|jgi:hypothetical protein
MMRKLTILFFIIAIAGLIVFFVIQNREGEAEADLLVSEVVGGEELILDLTPRLGQISKSLMNMRLPGSFDAFLDSVEVRDLEGEFEIDDKASGGQLAVRQSFSLAESAQTVSRSDLSLWEPLLKNLDYFEHAAFKIVRGSFLTKQHDEFECLVKFSGLARNRVGSWSSISGKQNVTWIKGGAKGWQISKWKTEELSSSTSKYRYFSDRLDEALPVFADRARARLSIHQEEVIKYYQSGKRKARSYDFSPISMSQKPGVSVVDIDQDGFDDLYIMVRMGKNLLLRNRGDGTFESIAESLELAVEGDSTCALFADFDNDGDPDLMLGRSVKPSAYFENTGTWFEEVETETKLPGLVISMSAADYNSDGLLDVYFSTYRLGALGSGNPGLDEQDQAQNWPERFLSAAAAEEFRRRYGAETGGNKEVDFLNQVGPPNVLMVNQGGGKFQTASEMNLAVWKNTLQATWSDYDDDGDPDLYLANDFSSDHLFRNDREEGFTDVTHETGITTYGFGMGASFGDYNNDGRQDLYVTNMFSKAGRRILSKFEGINSDYLHSVNGNVLYKQGDGGQFERVSGLKPPSLMVAEAGWSWGGQFVDFDNDGDLDLHALSGYFTAPKELASEVDL